MKENNPKSALIDDDDEEGGDEPDLIAAHELNDIVDKQYSEIGDLKIKIGDNEEVQKKCVMNQRHLLDYKYTYITCNCLYCPELGDNICYECIKSCHADHITDNRNIIQKSVNITQIYCSCAECGHKKKELNEKQEIASDEKISCQMTKLIGRENIINYYVDRSKNKFYCPFCRKNCMPEISSKVTPISVNKLRKEEFHCACKEPKYHSKKVDDITRLQKIFIDKKIEYDLCLTKIPGTLIKNNTFKSIFSDDLKMIFDDVQKSLLTDKRVRQNMNKTRYINEKYLNSIRLLKIFYQNLIINNAYEINTDETDFSDLFSFEFVDSLFELFSKYRKEMSQSELTHSNDTFLIQLKIETLFFFRNFVIIPRTKPFKTYGILADTENTTPLTRLITKKHFDEFLLDLNLEKEKFIEFIRNIWKTIERYDDHLVEYNLTEKLNSDLITEYFELLIILSTLRYTKNTDVTDFYQGIVIESFNSVVKIAKKYKIDSRNLKRRIEEFIKYTILNYNDEIFYREVLTSDKKAPAQSTLTFFNSTFGRKKADHGSTSMNDIGAGNLISNEEQSKISNQQVFQEIIEEEDPGDAGEQNEFNNANFIFESSPISVALLNSLFAFKKATNDYNAEFQKWEIYDWLASENDFYVESIKSFYETYNELPNESKLLIQHFRAFTKPCFEINNNIIDRNQNLYKQILKANNDIIEIFKNFFLSADKPEVFCDKLIEKLKVIKKLYDDNFPKNKEKAQIIERKLFQIYLYKFKIFDTLYMIYLQFQDNNFLAKFLPAVKHEALIKAIFDLFSIFSYDNLVTASILFSNDSLELFLGLNKKFSNLNLRVKFIEMKYYLQWLKNFKIYNNKLNLVVFCIKLKELYLYLEDLLSKNISDKGFKLTQEQEKLGIVNAFKNTKNTFSRVLMKVKEAVDSENKESTNAKSEFAIKSRQDAGKLKEEKIRMKKIEILNKKILDKLRSEGECYFNLDINFTSDDLVEKLIYIVNCLTKCCKLSSEKSVLILNNIILDIIYKLYKSPYYYQIWEKYKKSLSENLIEEEGSKYGVSAREVITLKLNDYKQASLIDTNDKITQKEHKLVINLYKLLYKIDDYSFYLITDEIPKFEIKILLQEKINTMNFVDRKALSCVYMRYYFISPFNILSNLNKLNMDSMTKLPDCNINGAIISTSKEELKSFSPYVRKKTREVKIGLFGSAKDEEFQEKEKKNTGQDRAFKFLKRYRIVEQSLGLEPLLSNLKKYRRLMKMFMQKDIVPKPYLFIKYFYNIILYPVVYSIYKLLYFTPVMTLHYKYLIYKIIYLFFECLRYFSETVIQNNNRFLENEKYEKMLKSLFNMKEEKDSENVEEIEKLMYEIIQHLDDIIEKMKNDPKFEPLKTENLLEYLCGYLKYFKVLNFLPLKLNGNKFRKDFEHNSGREILQLNTCNLTRKINNFINFYDKSKNEGIENQTNILLKLFSEETGEDEPDIQQLKVNIILDLMYRMNFKHNKKLSTYARGKEDSFILISIINKIYKADPDLWHNCLVDIASVTKQVLKDVISDQLTFLIQHIYIDFHKLKDLSDNREGLNTELSAKNKFLILIEFLRLFCENHHKIYQTILINSNINKFYLKNIEESLDLLNFVLKIPTMVKNSIEYLNSKNSFLSAFKKYKKNTYFNEIIIGVTDFLIEIIQGCFESNMKYFELPPPNVGGAAAKESNEKATTEKEKKGEEDDKKRLSIFFGSINSAAKPTKKSEEKGNKDFEKYLETGYYCLDNLNNENDKLCLAQFLRFLLCFLEEPFNPRENKERVIKMFNPKKMLSGLAECTVKLFKQYQELLVEKPNNKNVKNESSNNEVLNDVIKDKDEIPDKFSDKLINLYLTNNDLNDNLDFIISSNIFRYLLMASHYKSAEKVRQCLRELKIECEEDNPVMADKNKNSIIGRREAYRFFSQIVKDVEIFYKPKDNLSEQERKKFREFFTLEEYKTTEENFQKLFELKGDVQKVVFFVDPASLFTEEKDRDIFIDNSPGDKNEKLNYLLEYMPTFKASMSIRRKLWKKQDNLLTVLYNINYQHAIFISTVLSILVNLLVLRSSFYINANDKSAMEKYQTRTLLEEFATYDDYYYNYDYDYNYINAYNTLNKSKIIYSMQGFLEEPNDKPKEEEKKEEKKEEKEEKKDEKEEEKDSDDPVWIRQELNTALIIFLTIINIIFILFLIGNWLYFERLKYEKEDEEEGETNNDDNKSQNESRSMNINIPEKSNDEQSFSILDTFKKLIFSDIQALIWNLLIGIIVIFSVDFHFLYSVQLFTMYFLIKTMYTFIYSVQIRYKQFLAAGFLILIVSLFFAMIKYKWFTGPDECVTYSECFLDMLNSGIRGGSGMGFGIKKLGQEGYLIELFLEWVLFFVVMLVLLNIISGVIVDTFQELREKSVEENETKLNICYICSLHRILFEKRGIDFEYHKDHEHNIMNYFNYIYKIEMTDESELNSLDYQVRQSIKNKRTDFFPINTCVSFSSNKK